MSIETWKSEFYPVPAEEIKTMEEALVHSLRKWQGLTKKSLRSHNLVQAGKHIDEEDCLINNLCIDSTSCALCIISDQLSKKHGGPLCKYCQLSAITKADLWEEEGCSKQYSSWARSGDARPMIRLIQKAIDTRAIDTKAIDAQKE